jgi:hypothetical protein
MKAKYIVLTILILAAALLFLSCVKNRSGETSFSGIQPVVQIPEGGMQNFGASALTFPGTDDADTALFRINYAATNVAAKDVTVTLSYDANALAVINSSLDPSSQYAKFPDSTYSFGSPTSPNVNVTVKAGQNYSAQVPFIVYPSKIDPTKSYMFPISITAGGGATISGDFGTIYYHVIGNPIAGSYKWDWTRWNNNDGSGSPTSSSFVGQPATFAPDNPHQVEVPSGYFMGARYVISFTNSGGVLSNFQVSLNPDDVKNQLTANGITVTEGPTILKADPVAHVYEFHYSVTTGTAYRYLIDKYYR